MPWLEVRNSNHKVLVSKKDLIRLQAQSNQGISLHLSNGTIRLYQPLIDNHICTLGQFILDTRRKWITHLNHNYYDFRRSNLIIVTRSQLAAGFKKRTSNIVQYRSQYKGVSRNTRGYQWSTTISQNGHKYYLGSFPTQEEAAYAYNEMAFRLYGPLARLNILP
jgi:hypothetical protein